MCKFLAASPPLSLRLRFIALEGKNKHPIPQDLFTQKSVHSPLNGQSFWNTRSDIESTLYNWYPNTHFYSYTPLTLAAEKENQSLAKFILNVKNNNISSDKKQTIKYTVTHRGGHQILWQTQTVKIEQASINDGNIGIA